MAAGAAPFLPALGPMAPIGVIGLAAVTACAASPECRQVVSDVFQNIFRAEGDTPEQIQARKKLKDTLTDPELSEDGTEKETISAAARAAGSGNLEDAVEEITNTTDAIFDEALETLVDPTSTKQEKIAAMTGVSAARLNSEQALQEILENNPELSSAVQRELGRISHRYSNEPAFGGIIK
jgi:hypothetical protein